MSDLRSPVVGTLDRQQAAAWLAAIALALDGTRDSDIDLLFGGRPDHPHWRLWYRWTRGRVDTDELARTLVRWVADEMAVDRTLSIRRAQRWRVPGFES